MNIIGVILIYTLANSSVYLNLQGKSIVQNTNHVIVL